MALNERPGRLHTALLADVMDRSGFREPAVGPGLRPMAPGQRMVEGVVSLGEVKDRGGDHRQRRVAERRFDGGGLQTS